MKIAVICNYLLLADRVGGMDRFFWSFDRKCREKGYSISWFFPNNNSHGEYKNMNISAVAKQSPESTFLRSLERDHVDYDFVITHFVELFTPFFSRVRDVVHGKIIAVDHNPRPIGGYGLKKRIEKRLKGQIYGNTIDIIVGVSQYTVNEIKKDFGSHILKRCVCIYNGVSNEKIIKRREWGQSTPSFLVASHLRESKGIQDLMHAVSQIPAEFRESFQVDVYGDGPYKQELELLCMTLGIRDCFVFKGSNDSLHQIYYLYDFMLQPTHMECFSLSILESLSADVPVITTEVGGNLEVVKHGENGFIFPARDINALKEILMDILTGRRVKRQSQLLSGDFTIDRMVEEYFNLMKPDVF